jgi:hypothetical protein
VSATFSETSGVTMLAGLILYLFPYPQTFIENQVLFTADLRDFRDYGNGNLKLNSPDSPLTPPMTPQKRKIEDVLGSTDRDLPLTPPATVNGEAVSLDFEIRTGGIERNITEHIVRRSAKRNVTDTMDSLIGKV